MELPEELQKRRRGKEKRQEDIAVKLGVSREVLSRYENGKLNLTLRNADKLANLLGLRVMVELVPIDEEEGA